ncbi:MICOS complex subunit MIC27-like isoform X2, partial [Dinothrombium tinctorium]
LPLYGNPHPPKDRIMLDEPNLIEEGIRSARVAIASQLSFLDGAFVRGKQIVETAVNHSRTTYDYITDETNNVSKAVAITGGGLLGLLLSARKGFFKKVLYSSLGVVSAAAVCYPKQSLETIQVSAYIVKNKGPSLLKEYTGIDIEKHAESKKKVEDTIEEARLKSAEMPKSRDQSKPADRDLISNRSSK